MSSSKTEFSTQYGEGGGGEGEGGGGPFCINLFLDSPKKKEGRFFTFSIIFFKSKKKQKKHKILGSGKTQTMPVGF
jgi:hypothetical protein